MEVEVNSSRSDYVVASDGTRIPMRTTIKDLRGHISELLGKAVRRGSLDQTLSAADKEALLPFTSQLEVSEMDQVALARLGGQCLRPWPGQLLQQWLRSLPAAHRCGVDAPRDDGVRQLQ
jgi:hypothetical protein